MTQRKHTEIKYNGKTKVCPKCKKEKEAILENFYPNAKGHICWCKECVLGRAVAWSSANPERAAMRRKRWKLKALYKISIEEFDRLFTLQDGKCAICLATPDTFHVDHDHSSGEVRGLLCFPCNAGLGNMKDDPQLMRAGANYLERNKCQS